jgi:hypothetical protein
VGISFNTQIGDNTDNNIYWGAAYHHFNKATKVSFYGNPNYEMIPKWVASGGLRINISEYGFFTLLGDYSKQGAFTEIMGGALYSWKLGDMETPKYILHGGAFLRWQDALVPVVKLAFKQIAVSVSYDANISPLKSASHGRGGVELALSYQAFLNNTNPNAQAVRCPVF